MEREYCSMERVISVEEKRVVLEPCHGSMIKWASIEAFSFELPQTVKEFRAWFKSQSQNEKVREHEQAKIHLRASGARQPRGPSDDGGSPTLEREA